MVHHINSRGSFHQHPVTVTWREARKPRRAFQEGDVLRLLVVERTSSGGTRGRRSMAAARGNRPQRARGVGWVRRARVLEAPVTVALAALPGERLRTFQEGDVSDLAAGGVRTKDLLQGPRTRRSARVRSKPWHSRRRGGHPQNQNHIDGSSRAPRRPSRELLQRGEQ